MPTISFKRDDIVTYNINFRHIISPDKLSIYFFGTFPDDFSFVHGKARTCIITHINDKEIIQYLTFMDYITTTIIHAVAYDAAQSLEQQLLIKINGSYGLSLTWLQAHNKIYEFIKFKNQKNENAILRLISINDISIFNMDYNNVVSLFINSEQAKLIIEKIQIVDDSYKKKSDITLPSSQENALYMVGSNFNIDPPPYQETIDKQ